MSKVSWGKISISLDTQGKTPDQLIFCNAFSRCMSLSVPSEPRYRSVDDFAPALSSLMMRAATCGKLGPGAKLTFDVKPYLLLNAASSSANPFLPPKVDALAISVTSPSFLAPDTSCSRVVASAANAWKAPTTSMWKHNATIRFNIRNPPYNNANRKWRMEDGILRSSILHYRVLFSQAPPRHPCWNRR